jgi:hypothetical protein
MLYRLFECEPHSGREDGQPRPALIAITVIGLSPCGAVSAFRAMPPGDVDPRLQALGNQSRLLRGGPPSAPDSTGDQLDPAIRVAFVPVLMHGIMADNFHRLTCAAQCSRSFDQSYRRCEGVALASVTSIRGRRASCRRTEGLQADRAQQAGAAVRRCAIPLLCAGRLPRFRYAQRRSWCRSSRNERFCFRIFDLPCRL